MMLISPHSRNWLLTVLTLFVFDAVAAPGPPNINKCNNKKSLTAVPVQDLSFGEYIGSIAGTITVTPAGSRIAAGPELVGGTVTAAAFDVSNNEPGCDIYPVQIALPASASIVFDTFTMAVDTFISSPAGQFTLSVTPGQATRVYVGATLNSTVNQSGGDYLGPFDVDFIHVP